MWNRIALLLRARIAAQPEGANVPIAALFMTGSVSAFLFGAVRDALGQLPYSFLALTVMSALVALPLIGEFGAMLVHDETGDWVRALPVSPFELRAARALHVVVSAIVLASAPLVVAALLAPSSMALAPRVELVVGGLGLAITLAALSIWIEASLAGRADDLLVGAQTALFAVVMIGVVVGLRFVPELSTWTEAPRGIWLAFPPRWFAAPFAARSTSLDIVAALCIALCASALVFAAPPARGTRPSTRRGLLSSLLAPLCAVARRTWIRRDERASFELVFAALPREREFVLRTYPLIGVPIAFLALGMRDETSQSREALSALLLLAPIAYLPILVAHTAVSRSHLARWIQDTAPIERAAITNGALKAVVLRFVVPLYAVLFAIGVAQGRSELALRLAPIAFATAIVVVRIVWPMCVADLPLSIPPENVAVLGNWGNLLLTLGVASAVLAVVAELYVTNFVIALVVLAALIALELALDRAWRAKPAT